MANLEHFTISIRYSNSERRSILLELLPDALNIADVAVAHNLPIEVIRGWYDLSEHVLGAYQLDEHRNPGFLLAHISD